MRTPGITPSYLLLVIVVFVGIKSAYANPTCILNCAQCVQLYGDFFDGYSCSRACMDARTRTESFVDCADPTNIARFIRT